MTSGVPDPHAASSVAPGTDAGSGAPRAEPDVGVTEVGPTPSRWAVGGALAYSTALVALAAALIAGLPDLGRSTFESPWWLVLPIAGAFVVAERFLFNLDVRREAISFSLSEVPTVFALAFLPPVQAVVVRVLAGVAVSLLHEPPPAFKTFFNASLFALETAVAFAVVRLVVPLDGDPGTFMIAATLGLFAAAALGLLSVCLVISFFEGRILPQLRLAVGSTALTAAIGALIGAVAVAPAFIGLEYAWMALLPIVGAWALMRRHGVLFQRHSDLRDLHTFGRLLARDLRFDAVADDALAEIGRLVGAADVSLALDTTEHADGHVWIHGAPIPASGAPIPDPEATTSPTDAVGTSFSLPVVSEDGPLGMLSLGGSLRRPPVFVRNDVDRARDLADQLASSLRNGMLHTEVQRAATIDALTGHANRLDFERLLSERLQHISSAECTGVLVIDLNGFKHVNETLGHHVGDQVLVEFARRVALLLDEREVLARFSGDEFGVLATRTSREDLRQLADQIVTMSYRGLELPSCDAVVTASVGLAVATELDVDPAAVIRRADIAMRAAKHQRRGVEEYRDEIDRRTPARLTLLGDLRAAIERDDLDVYYQPKIDLRSDTIIGAEALLRWEPTGRGAITPAEFIGVAEESGIVRLLSDVVLTKAIRRARRWRDLGFALDVSINLSALDLQDDSLVDRVSGRLEEHGLAARHVVFEITESALMVDSERATATIERLDLLGVRLSLDDFGTGYSSLSHLRRLPVSELKIDRSFVRDLLLNVSDDVIVRSTIDLGHNLGLRVVAEGIENAQIGEHLARLGCDVGQGFAVSRPLAPDLFERWLDTTVHDVARIPVEPASI